MKIQVFQILIYALASLGMVAVSYTGAVSTWAIVLGALAVPTGLWLDRQQRILLPVQYARIVFALVMAATLAEWYLLGVGWFYAVLDLLLMVAAVKLVSPKANRDFIQIVALGFLLILATSILTTDAIFSVFFLAYVFLLSWVLMTLTVKSVLERDADPVRSAVATRQFHAPPEQARGLLEKKLLANAVLVIGFVLVFTVAFFLLFPRFGAGVIGGSLGQNRNSGMSDEIRFDDFGALKPDDSIALRIVVEEGTLPLPAYIRGNVLDQYKNYRWKATANMAKLMARGGHNIVAEVTAATPGIQYRLLAEDLGVQALPTISGTWKVRYKTNLLYTRNDGTVIRPTRFQGAFGFDGYAIPNAYPLAEQLFAAPRLNVQAPFAPLRGFLDKRERRRFLQLEADGRAAATRLWTESGLKLPPSASRDQKYSAVLALAAYLRDTYTYSLLPAGTGDPLQTFLDRQAGHCEYFATSLALALRQIGIPARVVTGFLGGELSQVGDYIIVRNSDAHSWVEYWVRDYGWLAIDPTPPYIDNTNSLWSWAGRRLEAVVDVYRLWWINQVISYDLNNQSALISDLGDQLSIGNRKRGKNKLGQWFKKLGTPARIGIGVSVAVIFLVFLWWTFRPAAGGPAGTALPYSESKLMDRLRLWRIERRHGRRHHSETWLEYLYRQQGSTPANTLDEPDLIWLFDYIQRRYKAQQD